MDGSGLSRRQLVRGMGLIAGGGLVAPVAGAALAGPASAAPTPGAPTTGVPEATRGALVAAVAPAVDPAWEYLTIGAYGWVPDVVTGTTVGSNGFYPSDASCFFRHPLELPQGAVVREVSFFAYNASPSTGVSVIVWRQTPPAPYASVTYDFTTPAANAHVVTLTSGLPTIDNTTTAYGLMGYLPTGGTFALQGARVAWSNGLVYTPITPTRVYDSRWSSAGGPVGVLHSGTSRTISVADARNGSGVTQADLVPVGAKAITMNLTVTGTTGGGFLAVTPGGSPGFTASTINWSASGQTLANGGDARLDSSRHLKVFCGGGGSSQFLVDVTGYYL